MLSELASLELPSPGLSVAARLSCGLGVCAGSHSQCHSPGCPHHPSPSQESVTTGMEDGWTGTQTYTCIHVVSHTCTCTLYTQ